MTTTAITPTLSVLDAGGHESTLGLVVALVLLVLLIVKDIGIGIPEEHRDQWTGALNIAIVPLGMTFVVIAITSVIEAVS